MEIYWNEEQKKKIHELDEMILEIEKTISLPLDGIDGNAAVEIMNSCLSLFGTTGRIMEIAKAVHSSALSQAADAILTNEKLLNAKQDVQRAFLKGSIGKWEGKYERADRVVAALTHYIDGLRSVLSYYKEHMNKFGGA